MAGTVRALPLGPRLTALRVFGTHLDAPGVADVVRSGRLLKEASTAEGMGAATDTLAQGAGATAWTDMVVARSRPGPDPA